MTKAFCAPQKIFCCRNRFFASPILTGNAILLEVGKLLGWIFGVSEEPNSRPDMEAIYLKYRRLMYATAGKFTNDPEDQKDIVQTAMERLIKIFSAPRGKVRCVTAGYIVFTVRSVSIDFLRKQAREAKHCISIEENQLAEIICTDGSLEDLLLSSNSVEQLWDIWPQLSPEERILLEGKYILGLSGEELATILKCKTENIWMKLTRARRRAAKLLSERNTL